MIYSRRAQNARRVKVNAGCGANLRLGWPLERECRWWQRKLGAGRRALLAMHETELLPELEPIRDRARAEMPRAGERVVIRAAFEFSEIVDVTCAIDEVAPVIRHPPRRPLSRTSRPKAAAARENLPENWLRRVDLHQAKTRIDA